jgi:DNA repair protein RecN (Recombination protein N)
MLTHLSIQGLAIIDSLSISFSPGFNVITGETGAGKSILIKALNLLMGAKASPDTIRKGNEQATVVGEFSVPTDHPALIALENLGIPIEEGDDGVAILVRRQVTAKGRSQSWVNDVALTNQPLRELGAYLIDVFGQHENQRLMDATAHTTYLDSFLKDSNLRSRVEHQSRRCFEVISQLAEHVRTFHDRSRDKDYVSFRLATLKEFEPSSEDYDRVRLLCEQAERSVELRTALTQALNCLNGTADNSGVAQSLREATRLLGRISASVSPQMKELHDRAEAVATELDDLNYELERLSTSFDIDEGELESAQERVFGYQDLFRKHAVTDAAGLAADLGRLDQELKFLESATTLVEELLEQLAVETKALTAAAGDLTKARLKAAKVIKQTVESELHELAMPGSIFEVQFGPVKRTTGELDLSPFGEKALNQWNTIQEPLTSILDSGAERAQFMLASNPGEPILPLARIASGGELSRIMLAFKRALAADADTCVLVFDEIDTGISGRVADVVGLKMQSLATRFQVLCISHLPQVAVYADTHFLVKKKERGERTETSIIRLSNEESAKEIARLLSGAELSSPSLANAKSLIEKARMKKPKKSPARREARA